MAVEDDRKVVFGGIRGGCGGVLSPDSAGCVEASRCKDRFGGGWMKGDGTDGAFVAGVKGRERGVGAEGEDGGGAVGGGGGEDGEGWMRVSLPGTVGMEAEGGKVFKGESRSCHYGGSEGVEGWRRLGYRRFRARGSNGGVVGLPAATSAGNDDIARHRQFHRQTSKRFNSSLPSSFLHDLIIRTCSILLTPITLASVRIFRNSLPSTTSCSSKLCKLPQWSRFRERQSWRRPLPSQWQFCFLHTFDHLSTRPETRRDRVR